MTTHENRLAEIRSAIEAENVSYGELAELQDIAAEHPELFARDALLAEAAGIPEEEFRLTKEQQRENADRRNRALTVLAQYADIAGTEDEAAPLWAADLLADILHLLGETVFDKCLRTARMHYEAERRGEE
jgi:hypothetical protein